MNKPDLQQLQDRADIHDVLMRYIRAADTRDWELARQVFAPTFVHSVSGVASETTVEATIAANSASAGRLVERVRRVTKRTADAVGDLPLKLGSHFVGSIAIEVEGDVASAETYAVANMFFEEDGKDYVLMRGIRYLDRLARLAEGWRITHRGHTLDWSRESPVDYAVDFAKRQTVETLWPR